MIKNSLNIKNFRTLKKFFLEDDKGKVYDKKHIIFEKKVLANFSSNDYLGLSQDKRLKKNSVVWTKKYGTGISSSRLVTGNFDFIENLEKKLANSKKFQCASILSTGFQCNSTVIPAILDNTLGKNKEAFIFSDKLNHYSLNLGCFISRQPTLRYNHLDLNHLEMLLKKNKNKKNKLIVTETVFSMNGDSVNISNIRLLAKKYNCMLYFDEAHSVGIDGINGLGIIGEDSELHENEVVIGTFSKAFGSFGSYVLCSQVNKNRINNYCSGFIYSTALPPSVLGAIDEGVKLIPTLRYERIKLHSQSEYLRSKLIKLGFNILNSDTHIIPILFADQKKARKTHKFLLKKGFFVSLIRPPTVPRGKSRLRISLSSSISMNSINNILKILELVAKN